MLIKPSAFNHQYGCSVHGPGPSSLHRMKKKPALRKTTQMKKDLSMIHRVAKKAFGSYKGSDRTNAKIQSHGLITIGNATVNTIGFKGFPSPPYGRVANGMGLCLKEPEEKKYSSPEEERMRLKLWNMAKEFVMKYRPDWVPKDRSGKARFVVQFARTKAVKKHRDTCDVITQLASSFGAFTGGRLVLIDDEGNETHHVTKDNLCEVDGRDLHYVEEFHGERYSMIFYANWTAASEEDALP